MTQADCHGKGKSGCYTDPMTRAHPGCTSRKHRPGHWPSLGVLLAILTAALSTAAFAADEDAIPLGKLPTSVTPIHYALDLTIVPQGERFSGRAEIAVNLATAQDRIWLHGKKLRAIEAFVRDEAGKEIAARYREMDDSGVASLELERPVGPGSATLVIVYDAAFGDGLRGLYKATVDGKSYAYTQFEPLSARQAFPSFDEPRFKTPYDVTLTVPDDHSALSNAPEKEAVTLESGLKQVRFETTKPLPTYLIAFAVGDFDIVEWPAIPANAVRKRPLPLRGIAVRGKGERFDYALRESGPLVEIFEDYFGLPYPYEKLDLVAAADFSSSGMENAGLMIYRESGLLFDDQPSIYQERDYAFLHAHEIAHNWFGNLVTPKWWDDLWLNEAFATWLSSLATHAWRPADYDNRGPLRSSEWAMWTDQLVSARQIRQPIGTHHDVSSAFDGITYSKGAGVLAMFERYLGAERFRTAVRTYLKRFPHGTASAEDFFDALEDTTEDPQVVSAFRSFIEQPGVPLLETSLDCTEGSKPRVTLRQSRYLPLGSKGARDRSWGIPACFAFADGKARKQYCQILREPVEEVALPAESCPRWLLPNSAGAGYYRWALEPESLQALLAAGPELGTADLYNVVVNAAKGYRSGLVSLEDLLAAAELASRATAWDVVKAPFDILRDIKNYILPRTLREQVMGHYRRLYRPVLERVGWSAKDDDDIANDSNAELLRGDLIWFLALDAEDPELRRALGRLGQAYLGHGGDLTLNKRAVKPELVRVSLNVAADELGMPFVETLLAHLAKTDDAVLRSNIVAVLAFQTDPEITARVRELALSGDVRQREASRLLYRQARRVDNRGDLWAWIQTHYDDVLERLPSGHLGDLPWLARGFCSLDKRDAIEAFFAPKAEAQDGGPRALANVLERIELCAGLVEAQRAGAVTYFERQAE